MLGAPASPSDDDTERGTFMEIVIAAQGLPFGPTTLEHRSLGGSETAAMQMARELQLLGHLVSIFCNLPPKQSPDYIASGVRDDVGLRWVAFEEFPGFISNTEVDLLVISRNPDMLNHNHQAKKAVLWMHDLATYQGFLPRLMGSSWNFDEIWTVSEWHKKQIHDITGYPLEFIKATRNGIVKFDDVLDLPREEKTLLYSARPERGLENLVRPGGIMSHLSDFQLRVTMYDNFPEHMMNYYNQLWTWAGALDNVELVGPRKQIELRQMMRSHWAYCYPTAFEEVSCIIARECMEQHLPFITNTVGALPETLGACGIFTGVQKEDANGDEFCEKFAAHVRMVWDERSEINGPYSKAQNASLSREDLYWPDVAKQWESWASVKDPTPYSLITSLIKDGDIIPALEYAKKLKYENNGVAYQLKSIKDNYPFLVGDTTFEEHYKGIYIHEDEKQVRERKEMLTLEGTSRFNEIALQIEREQPSTVLEYGCAEGPIILGLARKYPSVIFYGIDFVPDNIRLCMLFAKEHNIENVRFAVGSTEDWPTIWTNPIGTLDMVQPGPWDMTIVAEVLEHVKEPWLVSDFLESKTVQGGRLILTVPQGPWEWSGLRNLQQWNWRAHIWHIDKWMLRKMYDQKEEPLFHNISNGIIRDGRCCGNLVMSFKVDRVPCTPIDPIEKALSHRARQSIAACIILMNAESTVIRTLNSIEKDVDWIQIALGPCTDNTEDMVNNWAKNHPWIHFHIIDVPKIEAKNFGFDDARNASIEHINADWILWIDSDEYLAGDGIQLYLRNNCFDSYAIFQHHFTCEPRGEGAQLDKPARLLRNDGRFQFYGKVHEHAELGYNGGPGFVMILPNIDIGHTGYVNEVVRRERFDRNFPLLEWDHEKYPDRKLGLYLWLRDIVHRGRILDSQGNAKEARRLAEEAIEFYLKNVEVFGSVGGGLGSNQALAFYGEALQYLGRGFPVAVQIQLEEQTASYQGIFETAEEALELGIKGLKDELRKRKSGYWA